MIVSYTFFFLALFALFFQISIEQAQKSAVFNFFSKETFESYVHHKRDHAASGIKMKELIDPHSKRHAQYCEIFTLLINDVYQEANFHQPELAQELLKLFQDHFVIGQHPHKEGKTPYTGPDSLDELVPPKQLVKAYWQLVNQSECLAAGFPCLKKFFAPKESVQDTKLNLYDSPLEIFHALFGQEVVDDLVNKRLEWEKIGSKQSPLIEQDLLHSFLTQHNLLKNHHQECLELIIRPNSPE